MDPKEMATVLEVTGGSSAEKDGFRVGDQIVSLQGQPLLSIADLQWGLHNAPDAGQLQAEVVRGGQKLQLPLTLEPGWRRHSDISWRATSWDLRRMTTGGLKLEELSADDRRQAGLSDESLALRIKHVGQYGAHAAAKNAGFQKGDILVALDGSDKRLSESELMTRLINDHRPGDRVPVVVLRNGKSTPLELPMQ
jgi:S1-C subfamily serine protease